MADLPLAVVVAQGDMDRNSVIVATAVNEREDEGNLSYEMQSLFSNVHSSGTYSHAGGSPILIENASNDMVMMMVPTSVLASSPTRAVLMDSSMNEAARVEVFSGSREGGSDDCDECCCLEEGFLSVDFSATATRRKMLRVVAESRKGGGTSYLKLNAHVDNRTYTIETQGLLGVNIPIKCATAEVATVMYMSSPEVGYPKIDLQINSTCLDPAAVMLMVVAFVVAARELRL
ncbi:Hypothetical Protein FCC1311_080292 [Hondaea fermentalgiana]|uniref:Uncharacterized protein n=1 Tax=Hondaea fermentalgiana TaxID=2315210 RepID=A0A2R5GV62_9STRA|nr:Hypothetical Protein FCC1311_080292 [Hondaea fermentalgiana]|eukprot:GBG31804.1 Hypothetical Protein FCC1311_080292 [Hondaea fermentalgiana]